MDNNSKTFYGFTKPVEIKKEKQKYEPPLPPMVVFMPPEKKISYEDFLEEYEDEVNYIVDRFKVYISLLNSTEDFKWYCNKSVLENNLKMLIYDTSNKSNKN